MKNKSLLSNFKQSLHNFGYIIPDNPKFWQVAESKEIGLQVGEYTHSCHVDTTEFVILLLMRDNSTVIEEFSNLWDIVEVKE